MIVDFIGHEISARDRVRGTTSDAPARTGTVITLSPKLGTARLTIQGAPNPGGIVRVLWDSGETSDHPGEELYTLAHTVCMKVGHARRDAHGWCAKCEAESDAPFGQSRVIYPKTV